MKKYGKSLLSVAASIAISSTILSAGYVPLTNATNDNRWVLFGVSGFATDGTPATEPGVFRIVSSIKNRIIDTTQDDIFVDGLTVTDGNLGSVKAISSGVNLEVRVDTSPDGVDIPYSETEPFRTMYVDSTGGGAPTFAFTYKASLEGLTLEYSINDGFAFEVEISSEATFSSPVAGVKISGLDASAGTYSLDGLDALDTDSAVDYNLTNNPQVASEFRKAHRDDEATNDSLRVYDYDSTEKLWKIYDSGNAADTNDITTLIKSKAYWAKMDTNAGDNTTSAKEGGIVLGTPSLTTDDYTASVLTDGWNLMSFDAASANIRHASTGMKITLNAADPASAIQIIDSSGNHQVDVNSSGTAIEVSKRINTAIYNAKLKGEIPYTFDLRSFPAAALDLVLISNKRFTLKDENAHNSVASAKSLFDAFLLDPTDLTALTISDITSAGATSKYGEHAMIVEPLTAQGTASAIGAGKAKIEITAYESATENNDTTYSVDTSSATFAAAITHASLKASVLSLDINSSYDQVLISSEHPFSIRDKTFSRVFEFLNTAKDGEITTASAGAAETVVIPFDNTDAEAGATAAAAAINGLTRVDANSSTKYVVAIANDTYSEFNIFESGVTSGTVTDDILTVADAGSVGDLAKGAIKGIYSLDYLSQLAVKNETEITTAQFALLTDANDTNDSVTFTYTTEFQDVAGSSIAPNSGGFTLTTGDNNLTVINALVAGINADFETLGITSVASHDYNKTNDAAYKITVTGEDIIGISMVQVEGSTGATEGSVAATASDTGYTTTPTPDLAGDLKNNSVASPDYVMDGPLYTMKENGFTLKALVTGTTDLSDGKVTWDSIDLTRLPSEWLDSQDYNLFSVDAKAGYWAYLETDATTNNIDVSLSTINTTGAYVHHFDATSNETDNEFSANIDVEVTGLSDADDGLSARVTAVINGNETELTRTTGTNSFTGKISNHETEGFGVNSNYELVINVADGLGYKFSKTFANAFDNLKPTTPVTSTLNGVISVDTNDTSVAGFYVFSGAIAEIDTLADSGNLIGHLTEAGTVTVACEDADQVVYNSNAGSIRIISVDGTGLLNGGNASDAASENFMPLLKSRIYVENTNNGGVITATTGGIDYNTSCVAQPALTIDTGVSISAITSDKTVKMAYPNLGEKVTTAVPTTVYVRDGATASDTVVKISYPSTYIGQSVFVELNNKLYGLLLTDGTNGPNSDNPFNLTTESTNPKGTLTF